MIKIRESLSMQEAAKYIKKDEKNAELTKFINDFTKITPKDAEELKKMLENLGIMKLKKEYIVKIIDMTPDSQEELNKILASVSLSEDESTKVLDSVKKFK